jgi:transcriptional regulator with XRE-family HTH domain
MVRVVAERYAKGETMAELAEVYGVSEPTIWRALTNPFEDRPGRQPQTRPRWEAVAGAGRS